MAELEGAAGQAAGASTEPTQAAPTQTAGEQSAATAQTTSAGPDGVEESFFDPKSLEGKPELQTAYKQMQGKFTKRMQEFKQHKTKVEAYDSFIKDPMGAMKQVAQQYGFKLVQDPGDGKKQDWNPQSWDDVMAEAENRVLKRMEPVVGELRQMKQQNVEAYLDNNHSDWRTYEDDMVGMLQKHPSLAQDPDLLYRMSVPSEVLEARAAKAALQKLKNSGESGQISGTSTATKQTTDAPPKGGTFNDYVAFAKAKLAKQGIRPPGG